MSKKILICIIIVIFATVSLFVFIGWMDSISHKSHEIPCEGGYITFEYPPVDLDKIEFICPLGGMHGDHITPTDHQYYHNNSLVKVNDSSPSIKAYSPADGIITKISHKGGTNDDGSEAVEDYQIYIQHTCTIYSTYIHLDNLSDRLMDYSPPPGEYAWPNVEVSAGEVIGNFWESIDYSVADMDVNLPFVVPEHYESNIYVTHISNPFDYFNSEIKNKMISKCLRKTEPYGGKICYDIKGKLVGTWFLEDTNYYAGLEDMNYCSGHLVFAYDWIDPSFTRISIGPGMDLGGQWGIRNNSIDPADISLESGIIKIELVGYHYKDFWEPWDALKINHNVTYVNKNENPVGVLLCEIIDDYTLKMEIFKDKTVDEVEEFTDNYLIFKR